MRGLSAALGLALAASAAWGEPPAGPGAALYLAGTGAEVTLVGGVRLPATRFACANCHGADGRGGGEGATAFPPVADAAGDAPAFLRAVTEGVTPDGRVLGVAMPRYAAPAATLADLTAWVGGLAAAETRGITPDAVRLSRPAGPGAAAGMALAVARINAGGSLFGRRLVVAEDAAVVLTADALAAAAAPAVRRAAAGLAAARLSDRGETAADPGPEAPPELLAALAAAGITAAAGRPALVCLGHSCPDDARPAIGTLPAVGARLAAGTAVLIAPSDAETAPLLAGPDAPAALAAWTFTLALEPALTACGRAVTRSCLLRELPRADLADAMAVYDR